MKDDCGNRFNELLLVHKEWNELICNHKHKPKFWCFLNGKKCYECKKCGLFINSRQRIDKIFGRSTPIGKMHP